MPRLLSLFRRSIKYIIIAFIVSVGIYYLFPFKLSTRVRFNEDRINYISIHRTDFRESKVIDTTFDMRDPGKIKEICNILKEVRTLSVRGEDRTSRNYNLSINYNSGACKYIFISRDTVRLTEGSSKYHGYLIPAASAPLFDKLDSLLSASQ